MSGTEVGQQLGERARNILKVLIREYVHSGKPVGSRRLARAYHEGLSSSTVRNIMAGLEEMGFLAQPHASAGRIPTDKGYRFYVGALLKAQELSSKEVEWINQSLEQETDPGELMTKTSQLLSTFSNNVGFVLTPPLSLALLKHIEFVRISQKRILVILVTRAGQVQHRLIECDEELSQTDLDQAGRYLVRNCGDKTLLEIREQLVMLMSEEKALYDRMLKNVVLLGSASLMKTQSVSTDQSEVYLGGTSRIFQKPELADINRMIELFETFEEKSRLIKIITECLETDEESPTVRIGLEDHIPGMRHWALVSSPYFYDDQVVGGLGILGPTRMEYARAISLVNYVAKLFGKILGRN